MSEVNSNIQAYNGEQNNANCNYNNISSNTMNYYVNNYHINNNFNISNTCLTNSEYPLQETSPIPLKDSSEDKNVIFECRRRGCGKTYSQKYRLVIHMRTHVKK